MTDEHDHKGYSEEKCVRCGWVMGHPALNCQNDNTPHVFPSTLSLSSKYRQLVGGQHAIDHLSQVTVLALRAVAAGRQVGYDTEGNCSDAVAEFAERILASLAGEDE